MIEAYLGYSYNGWCMIRIRLQTFNLSGCTKFNAGDKLPKTLKYLWIIIIVVSIPVFSNVLSFGT
jgi:hypothetical protein